MTSAPDACILSTVLTKEVFVRPNPTEYLFCVHDISASFVYGTVEKDGGELRTALPRAICPEPACVPGGSFYLLVQGVDPVEEEKILSEMLGPNRFKLTFLTNCHGKAGLGENGIYDGTQTRVVEAQNKKCAEKIGQAMLGEEVGAGEYLKEFKGAVPTDEPTRLSSWNDFDSWNRALRNLQEKGENVRFLWDVQKEHQEIIGIQFNS